MFENDIKSIADQSLAKIKKLGSFVTLDMLNKTDLHPAVLKYISAELDYLIHQDRKKLLGQSLFDYSGPETAKHFQMIGQELKKRKKISFEDIKKLVMQAVSFNANFSARPNWSLIKLVFNEENSRDAVEIKLALNYLYFYDYLKVIMLEYFEKKKISEMTQKNFGELLDRIDSQVLSKDPEKFIDNALYSMSDLFSAGAGGKGKLPPIYVEIFLKEKKLDNYLKRYSGSGIVDDKSPTDLEEIRKILYTETSGVSVEDADKIIDEEPGEAELNSPEEDKIAGGDEISHEADETVAEDTKEEIEPEEIELLDEKGGTEKDVPSEDASEEKNSEQENMEEELEDFLSSDNTELESLIDEDLLSFYESELKDVDEDSSGKNEEDKSSASEGEIEIVKEEAVEEEPNQLGMDFEKEEEDSDEDDSKTADDVSAEEIEAEDYEEKNYFGDLKDLAKKETAEEASGEEDFIEEDDFEEIKEEEEGSEVPAAESFKRDKDLFDYLSDKDIDKIVQTVFNDDREDFANTMERVTECSTYDEATEILKSVFLTYRVNPYTRDAVTLTDAVSNYFQQA